jgi:hypothetical protein
MRNRVGTLWNTGEYDVLLAYGIGAIQYCPKSSHAKLCANIEDPESIKLRRMAGLGIFSFTQRWKLRLSSALSERYERRHFPSIGKVMVLSKADASDLVTEYGYSNVHAITYGCERILEDPLKFAERTEGAIVFSGSMFHPPNVDGALFFCAKFLAGSWSNVRMRAFGLWEVIRTFVSGARLSRMETGWL